MNVGQRIRTVSDELVPLAQRMRYMRLFRLAICLGAVGFAVYAPDVVRATPVALAMGAAVYLGLSFAAELVWRLVKRRGLALFGAMLIVDGVFLAWMAYLTGGASSSLLNVILLHLVAVTLLASYRTGLKLAMWHSLLLLMVYQLQETGIPVPGIANPPALTPDAFHRLVGFVGVYWIVALATASFSAINERELRRRRYDLEALAKMASALETVSEGRDAASMLLDNLVDTFGFQRGVVLGKIGEDMSIFAARGDGVLHEASLMSADPIVLKACESRKTVLVPRLDPERDPTLANLLPDARNCVVVPLTAESGPLGVVVLEHSSKLGSRIERRVVSTVERFCSHAALALRNASLVDQLRDMAATDGLTGVANRRTFEAALEVELARAARGGSAVSLVLLDLDHFKRLNDEQGHQAGDEVLRAVATLLREKSRAFDTPARYGGEEFAVIMPGCDVEDAHTGADRLRHAIAKLDGGPRVTASAGVATFPVHATDASTLVKKADRALYESKRGGRNMTTVSEASLVEGADELLAELATTDGADQAQGTPPSGHEPQPAGDRHDGRPDEPGPRTEPEIGSTIDLPGRLFPQAHVFPPRALHPSVRSEAPTEPEASAEPPGEPAPPATAAVGDGVAPSPAEQVPATETSEAEDHDTHAEAGAVEDGERPSDRSAERKQLGPDFFFKS